MSQPAQTLSYMIAGYVVIFGALFAYLASLAIRWNALQRKKNQIKK
jgi:hypothetical protein